MTLSSNRKILSVLLASILLNAPAHAILKFRQKEKKGIKLEECVQYMYKVIDASNKVNKQYLDLQTCREEQKLSCSDKEKRLLKDHLELHKHLYAWQIIEDNYCQRFSKSTQPTD